MCTGTKRRLLGLNPQLMSIVITCPPPHAPPPVAGCGCRAGVWSHHHHRRIGLQGKLPGTKVGPGAPASAGTTQ